ncbi:MAG: hypothetical protein PWQ55_307 [Chloroflexota bacterium]|nr:hypothetical protein [Chloroflexota bacterium]
MTEKIPFQNRILALILSLVIIIGLFLSLFTLPVELIFFNPQSYSTVLQNEDYTQAMPGILSELLVYQAGQSSGADVNLYRFKDMLTPIFAAHISPETVQGTFDNAVNQTFAYLNFKIPTSDMKIAIGPVKDELSAASSTIASEFLAALPNCTDNEVAGLDQAAVVTAADLPVCKPGSTNLAFFRQMWTKAIEDSINSMPSSVALSALFPLDETVTDSVFYRYSLVRWGFRLVPVVSILLLILIAVLLRKQRKVMWKWIGWLLMIVSGLTLIGLVVLLIGFDQFIAMLLNPHLKNLVAGFGYILLGAVQDVGYQMLIWVIISAVIMLAFGLMLLIAGRMVKEPQPAAVEETPNEPVIEETPVEEIEAQKTVVPETMEETEQREKDSQEEDDDQAEA